MTNIEDESPPLKTSIGVIIDHMEELKQERRKLAAQDKILKEEYDNLEAQLLGRLDEEGITLSRGAAATASVSELTVFNVSDWDAFNSYVEANDASYLINKQPANAALRELYNQGERPPGIENFTKRSISLRKL